MTKPGTKTATFDEQDHIAKRKSAGKWRQNDHISTRLVILMLQSFNAACLYMYHI